MEANIQRMADFFKDKPAKLRPHIKTHKSPVLAHKQLAAGSAVGITAAKLGEAEIMAKAGIADILIANQIIEPSKIARLVGISKHTQITVAVDNLNNIEMLNQAGEFFDALVNVLIEVNVGLNRCGVEPGQPALELANEISKKKHIKMRGLMGYEGHVVMLPDHEHRKKLAKEAMEKLVGTSELLERNGYYVEIISGGGTGTYDLTGQFPGVDEVQAGSYLFMDSKYQKTGVEFNQALTLYTTVISRPNSEKAILDAGMKAISFEHGMPEIKDHPEWNLAALNEEHAILEIPGGDSQLKPGDKIELVPSHGCTTINLHDRYYALREERIEAIWPVEARGCFR